MATLFDRQGKPITAEEWARHRDDSSYRIVANELVVPTLWEVMTVWEGVPVPAAMFFTGVRCGTGRFVDKAQAATEQEALTAHRRVVAMLRDSAVSVPYLDERFPNQLPSSV